MKHPVLIACLVMCLHSGPAEAANADLLAWKELPQLPDSLGVAGPFAGVHNNALIVAGGANFPKPVWENDKVWRDGIHVLTRQDDGYRWKAAGKLPRPIAYGAAVSTKDGVVCIGGNDSTETFDGVFLLTWDAHSEKVTTTPYPSLPKVCAFSAATLIGDTIYVAGGQSGSSLQTAMNNFWSLDLSKKGDKTNFVWKELPPCPGPTRALNLTVSQHNGDTDCVYVMSGRRQEGDAEDPASFEFLRDVWEYNPRKNSWRQRSDAPRCLMAGTGIGFSPGRIFVLGGATEKLFFKGNELRDDHPGFIKQSLAYHTVTDTWTEAGPTPANHVTTIAVKWGDGIIIPSGEIRPRVRSPKVFKVTLVRENPDVRRGSICHENPCQPSVTERQRDAIQHGG